MKTFLFLPILLLYFFCASAQTPIPVEEVKGDTTETIESDSTITYIIRQPAVTIIEKFEVVSPKERQKYYLSIGFVLLGFHEFKKANSSYENYLHKINSSISNKLSYSIGTSIWYCPDKIYKGIAIDFTNIQQTFHNTDLYGTGYSMNNRYNYAQLGLQTGYWIKKEKKISCILIGAIQGDWLMSYSGYTFDKTNLTNTKSLITAIDYKKYTGTISINSKFLYNSNNYMLEIEPFVKFTPISATTKNEAYTLQRFFWGIKFGVSNKLF